MDLNGEFLQGIADAFISDKEAVRAKAHASLLKLAADDPNLLLSLSTGAFCNAALPASTRALTATLLGGLVMPREGEERPSIWPKLSAASKELVKEACLKQLIDPNATVMRAAAALVASVFAADCVHDNAWEQLLPNLTDNVENADVRVQKAAVTSLGNICDLLNKHRITELKEHRVDSLLTGICKGLRRYNELTETAVQALDDSLQFLKKKLDNEQIADFVMELLITILRETRQAPGGVEAERKLLYCLAKIAKILFARLGKYHQLLFDEVLDSYKRGDAGVLVACNHFFCAMVKLGERFRATYMDSHWKGVMELCLKRLSESEELAEEDEGAGSSTLLSVLDTMTAINRVYSEATAGAVRNFITAYIELPADDKKIVALVAFESMLEMPRSPELVAFVNSGFYGVLNFLQNGAPQIRRHASRLLLKIIRQLPEVFFADANFHRATKILLRAMEAGEGGEADAQLQHGTAVMFSELTLSARALPAAAALLRSIADALFDVVCRVALDCENLPVIDSYFSVVFDFLQRVVDAKYLGDYLLSFAKYLRSIRERSHRHQLSILEFLFINMTVIVTQVRKNSVKFFSHSAQSALAFLGDLYRTVEAVFAARKAIVSEGLMLMAAIIVYDRDWGRALLGEFLKKYAFPALQDYQNSDLFKAAVDSVSVCCKALEGELEPFVTEVYPYFLSLLSNDVVQKELKITIFFALSDFVLHCPAASRPHLPGVVALAELALEAVVHFQASEQEELVDYAEAFKETLIDFYLCFVHGVYIRYDDFDAAVEASMRKVSEFVRLTSHERLNPTINYQSSCLGLLVDFYCKKKMPQMVDVELVSALYKSLQKHANYGEVGGTLDYSKKHFSSL